MKPWSCGPAALVNALRALGCRVSEGRIRALAGTTKDGTDEKQLILAARALDMTVLEHHGSDKVAAWSFIRSSIIDGRSCLICVDHWRHWVTVVGIIGDRVLIFDPSNVKKNVSENGLSSMLKTDLLKVWSCPAEDRPFYAIAVSRKV
jgi:ABC-type bacteriocin/lantibiotic exporter with double-glycine peptidase domain